MPKGQKLFSECSGIIKYKNTDYEKAVMYNPAEYRSSPKPVQRESFFVDMNSKEFEDLSKMYLAESTKERMLGIINNGKRMIRIILNRIIIRGGKNKFDTNMDYGIIFVFDKVR